MINWTEVFIRSVKDRRKGCREWKQQKRQTRKSWKRIIPEEKQSGFGKRRKQPRIERKAIFK